MQKAMRVRLTGPTQEPEIILMKKGATIEREVEKRLGELSSRNPLVIQAQTGLGKTHAVATKFIPRAKEQGIEVLFICPRLATNVQAKLAFMKELGETALIEQLTDEGLRVLEKIGNVTVLTAQSLFFRMQSNPASLKKFGMVIFDEIHLLLDDALFASTTGYVLDFFQDTFRGAVRIYLSATPDTILPLLAEMEAPNTIKVLKFPVNYDFVQLCFFQDEQELISRINSDKSSAKWLVYVPTISEGKVLKSQLDCSVRLLNREERDKNREEWMTILKNEKCEEKVCIATAVIDVGVNFKDRDLQNIVIFSWNPNTIIQFLGRKRRTATEQVSLFVRCPTYQELTAAMLQNYELAEAVSLYHRDYPRFVQQHILPGMDRDLRGWVYVDDNGKLMLNSLVFKSLQAQRCQLEKLLQRAKENKGDCHFDKFVAHLLHIQLPNRSECWLDSRVRGTAKVEFEKFLTSNVGKKMDETDFSNFGEQFRDLCVAAFGKNGSKDRTDRNWGAQKICNKLTELHYDYTLKEDPSTKLTSLELIENQYAKQEVKN